jgi:hypothetical protein
MVTTGDSDKKAADDGVEVNNNENAAPSSSYNS